MIFKQECFIFISRNLLWTFTCMVMLAPPMQAAEPVKRPADVLNLSAWKLTLPYNTARRGNPDEVLQPELATFQDDSCFFVAKSGRSVIFRAECGGLGTENSNYPRSELREMQPNGKDEIGWSTTDAMIHTFEAKLAVNHTPGIKQHVVCAQIHDDEDDVIMIRLEKQKLFVERNGDDDVPLDNKYQLGESFDLHISAGHGQIKVLYNGEQKMDWKVSKQNCYFKAGCYTQSNVKKGEPPEAYGEVEYFHLNISHSE